MKPDRISPSKKKRHILCYLVVKIAIIQKRECVSEKKDGKRNFSRKQ